jgi:hypothetical protein
MKSSSLKPVRLDSPVGIAAHTHADLEPHCAGCDTMNARSKNRLREQVNPWRKKS